MKPTEDIRSLIAESLVHDACIDATEIALIAQKLHPQYPPGELVAMVVEQRSLARELKLWPNAGPHSL
jgi:hypothetical protein